MNKRVVILLVFTVIIIGLILIKHQSQRLVVDNSISGCQDKEFEIPLTLQSKESGILSITDNHCELPPVTGSLDLSFKVLEDGSIQDNIIGTKLYIWMRDKEMSIEGQIKSILSNRFDKGDLCLVQKSKYTQYDKLFTYYTYINPNNKLENLPNDYCLMFGAENNFASESYMEVNGLLIMERQDDAGGIAPFGLSSIKFVPN